jgi:hypothetical protein
MRTLTKVFSLLALAAGSLFAEEAPKKQIKLLTIGNSFANDATAYLPAFAKAGGNDLLLFRANLGGCSFERHARHLKAYEANPADPEGSPYLSGYVKSAVDANAPKIASGGDEAPEGEKAPPRKISLKEALESEQWDYVTIQQVSTESFKFQSFEPYAGTIIGYVRKHAPKAKILIHQTWAYREDCPMFKDGFDQAKMYDGLVRAYDQLSKKYNLEIIPVGTAMQEARKLPRWTFKYPDANFNYKNPAPGTKPDQTGSLMVGWSVKKVTVAKPQEKTAPTVPDKYVASLDFKHCNAEGRYLGASVFYGFLFGEKVSEIPFVPELIDPADAKVLRGIADEVLARKGTASLAK